MLDKFRNATRESSSTESFHDISDNINSLYTELLCQIEIEHKKSFNFITNNSYWGKEAKSLVVIRKVF